jgi:hypothetical protein
VVITRHTQRHAQTRSAIERTFRIHEFRDVTHIDNRHGRRRAHLRRPAPCPAQADAEAGEDGRIAKDGLAASLAPRRRVAIVQMQGVSVPSRVLPHAVEAASEARGRAHFDGRSITPRD